MAGATAVEVAALVALVHTLLHRAMLTRGLPSWRASDTLLASPLLWTGAALLTGALNRLVALAALGRGAGVAAALGVAAVGAVVAWFGMRAVGKLY